jgi:N-acetylglucosaminyl-diphospho-decaprenol L-rhamnosyltransferase
MDVSVLTVNYNTADLTPKCVQSALDQQGVTREVIVIDNASVDDSVKELQKFGDKIILVPNKDNLGFGKANNQAFRLSSGRYLFLLNPDANFLTVNDLQNAVRFMDEHPDYGLVGTRIVDSQGKHVVTISNHYPRQKQTTTDFSHLPGEWATVLGASMIIRRDVFEKLGGFDEDFFLYAEETDLCLRIRKAGYKIGYNDEVTVHHVGSASVRTSPPEHVIRRKKRAKYLFYSKHYSKTEVIEMAKKDLCHAKWHLWRLMLKKKVLGLNSSEERKYGRHKVTVEVAKEVLNA